MKLEKKACCGSRIWILEETKNARVLVLFYQVKIKDKNNKGWIG